MQSKWLTNRGDTKFFPPTLHLTNVNIANAPYETVQALQRTAAAPSLDQPSLLLVRTATAAMRPQFCDNARAFEGLQAAVDQLTAQICSPG